MTDHQPENNNPTGEPPGWHPDPWGRDEERWWNGFEWTDRTRNHPSDTPNSNDSSSSSQPVKPPRSSRPLPGGAPDNTAANRWANQDPPHTGWWPDPYGEADERWWDGERWTDRTDSIHKPGEAPTWTRRRIGILLATVAFIGLIIVNSNGSGSAPSSPPQPSIAGSEIAAYLACEDFTRQVLRSPSTAEFPGRREATITTRGQEWVVRAYVDAENAFGAMVRNEWRCTTRKIDGDTWEGNSTILDQ